MNQSWLVPTVIVGVLGIALQGLKAGWDLFFSIKTQKNTSRALRLQELSALMNLIDALPLDSARKAARKAELVGLFQRGALPSQLYAAVDQIISQTAGK